MPAAALYGLAAEGEVALVLDSELTAAEGEAEVVDAVAVLVLAEVGTRLRVS